MFDFFHIFQHEWKKLILFVLSAVGSHTNLVNTPTFPPFFTFLCMNFSFKIYHLAFLTLNYTYTVIVDHIGSRFLALNR